ncbi:MULTISPECIES: hypothetical protein [unclassified Streptomyces]|uniref:hypothetical protein n=1 Tax=unclassified Streptomyces TaxID=2593676 RepID=UPI000B881C7E|nr:MULTISPECIES: hypothetical protein [unclassified Streptomyces]MYZ37970.1 hypothetical protein [Streptomyces sp. SID4917]
MQRTTLYLGAMAMLWGDDGGDPVIMGASLVVLPVHRTRSRPVSVGLVNFGYRVMLPEEPGDNEQILTEIDNILVQGRRDAQVIAWHGGGDDLHVLRQLPRPEGAARAAGVNSVAEAWTDRSVRARGIVRFIDTAHDLEPFGLISHTAKEHGLVALPEFAGGREQAAAQAACEELLLGGLEDGTAESMAASVLCSAFTTALLGGKAAERLHWDGELIIRDAVAAVAWDIAPSVFNRTPEASSR